LNRILKKILITVAILIAFWAIFVIIDCIRLKNATMDTLPFISLKKNVDMEAKTYVGLGYTVSYAHNNDNLLEDETDTGRNDAEFRLFGKILIWSYVL